MAVKTSPFTGWQLSSEDEVAFLDQTKVENPTSKKLAREALARGREIRREHASISVNKKVSVEKSKAK